MSTTDQTSLFSLFTEPVTPTPSQSQPGISKADQLTAIKKAKQVADLIESLPLDEAVDLLNEVRELLHAVSPFRDEPVDYVAWVRNQSVYANSYNPNTVAPPEMELLAHSITTDGYTQPIVTMPTDTGREVVDGFHRNRVGKENQDVRTRVMGFLPVVSIKATQTGLNDRIAATIRHNRARGKHSVDAMSDIVVELKRRNWSDQRISKELGMDPDEVLRLTQITGLAELFRDEEFSAAWEHDSSDEMQGEILSDVIEGYQPKANGRILHTWEKWECYRAGFYAERPPGGLTMEEGARLYQQFLGDPSAFEAALQHVTTEWTHSCEHYLTNDRMNRIAWLGQAAAAHAISMPSCCRGGYHLLTDDQKADADALALLYLNDWLEKHGLAVVSLKEATGRTEAELY